MTLITLVLAAIGALLNPVGGRIVTPADIVGPIGEVAASPAPQPPAPATPQDIVGPIGE
jgi:hypothetical protein